MSNHSKIFLKPGSVLCVPVYLISFMCLLYACFCNFEYVFLITLLENVQQILADVSASAAPVYFCVGEVRLLFYSIHGKLVYGP